MEELTSKLDVKLFMAFPLSLVYILTFLKVHNCKKNSANELSVLKHCVSLVICSSAPRSLASYMVLFVLYHRCYNLLRKEKEQIVTVG